MTLHDLLWLAPAASLLGGFILGNVSVRREPAPRLPLPAKVTDDMVEAGCRALLSSWSGDAGQLGLTQPRAYWRNGMSAALRAALAAADRSAGT